MHFSAGNNPELPVIAGYGAGTIPHKFNTELLLITAICASFMAVMFDRWPPLLLLTLAGGVLFWRSQPSRDAWRSLVVLAALTFWSTAFSQALFYDAFPRHALLVLVPSFSIGGMDFDGLVLWREGVIHGVVQSLRFISTLLVGTALCLSASPEQLYLVLGRWRIPEGVRFMAITTVRFVPDTLEELLTIRKMMGLRGYRPFRVGVRLTLAAELGVVRPLLARLLRRSRDLATTLTVRGFEPVGSSSEASADFTADRYPARERLLLVGLLILVTGVAVTKLLFWLYLRELYYHEQLRPLYAFTRHWL